MLLSTIGPYANPLCHHTCHANRCSESHTLLKGANEILP